MIAYRRENKGYCYILTVVDVFSRRAWAQPLKTKTGRELVRAFEKIFKIAPPPTHLQTDRGKEFENNVFQNFLRANGVNFFTVTSSVKASLVERLNRTIKTRMFRYFTHQGSHQWVRILPQLMESYNLSAHRSLPKGMSPREASLPQNHRRVWLHQEDDGSKKTHSNILSVGDEVRISKYKGTFQKGYVANWSEETFFIDSVDHRFWPPMYTIKDTEGEVVVGKFYGAELQKVAFQKDERLYAIEKVIRRSGKRYLVQFLGYPHRQYWVENLHRYKQ
jgi:hypothetical protein